MAKFPGLTRKDAKARGPSRGAQTVDGFWDRPQLLNLMADLLLILGFAVLAYALVFAVIRLPFFPLRQVVVVHSLDQVTPAQIEFAAKSLSGNFFTVNLEAVRTSLERQPWVRHASVRRRWPDGIEFDLEEHVAAARWQQGVTDTRLVNGQGEVFPVSATQAQAKLPLFSGPEGSAPQVLTRYKDFSALLKPLGRTLRAVALSARQAWQLHLDDGLTLELGRDQPNHPIEERLARFSRTYAAVQSRVKTAIGAIDMRYPNGFALRPRSTLKGNT